MVNGPPLRNYLRH
ncbi:unnamed protein product, partial [Didymodactylos carnosus]